MKVLIGFIVIAGVSLSLAWVWHTSQQSVAESNSQLVEQTPADNLQNHSQSSETIGVVKPESMIPEELAETSEQAQEPADPTPSKFPGAVPQSPAVDNTYFDDALFIGDSISTGIPLYKVADNAVVLAMTGIRPDNIGTKPVIDAGGEERITILQACEQHLDRKKVYVMLGGNSLGLDKVSFIQSYRSFLKSIQSLYPDAVIYIQSITPVVEGYQNEFVPDMDNAKIDDYNREIMAMAVGEGAYYLDVASALKDETGALPRAASPTDGMHFTPEYYNKWFDYLRHHTVEGTK